MKQSYPLNPFDDAQPDATSEDSSGRLVCRNARGHERVEVDFNQRTVLFANCHQSDQAWVGPVVAALALLATAVIIWLLL